MLWYHCYHGLHEPEILSLDRYCAVIIIMYPSLTTRYRDSALSVNNQISTLTRDAPIRSSTVPYTMLLSRLYNRWTWTTIIIAMLYNNSHDNVSFEGNTLSREVVVCRSYEFDADVFCFQNNLRIVIIYMYYSVLLPCGCGCSLSLFLSLSIHIYIYI